MRVIAEVTKRLHQGPGSRFVIEGCKGSGKTLIMSVIAVLAKNIPTIKNVLIGDGRLGESLVLEEELREKLQDSDITVASKTDLGKKARECQLLMFDECNSLDLNVANLERYASADCHLILFASRSIKVGSNYKKLKLGNAHSSLL